MSIGLSLRTVWRWQHDKRDGGSMTNEMLSLLSILSEQSEESMDWRTVQISSNDDAQEEMI